MPKVQQLFTKEVMEGLTMLSLPLRNRMDASGYGGNRKSRAKGSSLEFSDFREYSPGDDLRRVDWNSYSRFGKVYLKLFLEEKQAAVRVFLDCSASMAQPEKFLQAKALAAALSYPPLRGNDQVEFFSWNSSLQTMKKDIRRTDQFLSLLEWLDLQEAKGTTDPFLALQQAQPYRRGMTILISDFLVDADWKKILQFLRYQKQEILLVQVLSEEELHPALNGTVRFVDKESGESQDLEIDSIALAAYEKALSKLQTDLLEMCKKEGAYFACCSEKEPLLFAAQKILYRRS